MYFTFYDSPGPLIKNGCGKYGFYGMALRCAALRRVIHIVALWDTRKPQYLCDCLCVYETLHLHKRTETWIIE